MDILKELNTEIRIIVISIVVTHHHGCKTEQLADDFMPALVKELAACPCYTSNWLLENYATIIEFVIDRQLLRPEYLPSLEEFLQVAVGWRNPGREACNRPTSR
jgi:hypothetical protein